MSEQLAWLLHVIFVLIALLGSWLKFRSLLHPHFVFTVIFAVMFSDFIVRGYEDENFFEYSTTDVISAQMLILSATGVTLFFAALLSKRNSVDLSKQALSSITMHRDTTRIFFVISIVILVLEFGTRLTSVDWSPGEVLNQSLNRRGDRAWDLRSYEGNAIFALIKTVVPLAGAAFLHLAMTGGGLVRIASIPLAVVVISLLVTDGSRTPVVIALAGPWLLALGRYRSFVGRLGLTATTAALVAGLTSLMVTHRDLGYRGIDSNEVELTYHQDDSYYRATTALLHSETTSFRWDAATYFGAIVANPIPRAIWPEKPLLDRYFYGGFKLDYVTTLHFGEATALGGWNWMLPISVVMGLFVYLILDRSVALVTRPAGTFAYLLVCLYAYMCVRSFLNLTQFMYLPIAASLLSVALANVESKRRKDQLEIASTV